MLIANICAATILSKSCLSSIYRIHPKPDQNKIKRMTGWVPNTSIKEGIKLTIEQMKIEASSRDL